MIEKLPEIITIHLDIAKDNFKLLHNRMLDRDIPFEDTAEVAEQKKDKIKKRLAYAKEELENFVAYKPRLMKNPLSRTFTITDDGTLYDEVIPYVKALL